MLKKAKEGLSEDATWVMDNVKLKRVLVLRAGQKTWDELVKHHRDKKMKAPELSSSHLLGWIIQSRGEVNDQLCSACYELGAGTFKGCISYSKPGEITLAENVCGSDIERNAATECEYREYYPILSPFWLN